MLSEQDILVALRDCFDLSLPCNIVDLGMVRGVRVAVDPEAPGAGIAGVPEKHRVVVEVAPANAADEARMQMSERIRNRLAGLEEVGETTVVVIESPPWSPQQITPEGRRILGLEGNPNLVQIR